MPGCNVGIRPRDRQVPRGGLLRGDDRLPRWVRFKVFAFSLSCHEWSFPGIQFRERQSPYWRRRARRAATPATHPAIRCPLALRDYSRLAGLRARSLAAMASCPLASGAARISWRDFESHPTAMTTAIRISSASCIRLPRNIRWFPMSSVRCTTTRSARVPTRIRVPGHQSSTTIQ